MTKFPRIPQGYPKRWLTAPVLLTSPAWVKATPAEQHLHLAACRLLGYDRPAEFGYPEYQLWFRWMVAGYVMEDLIDVITWRRVQNASGQNYSLRLSTILGSLSDFQSDLSQARKGQRPPAEPETELIQILPEGGQRRVEIAPETPAPRPIDDAQMQAQLSELRKLRDAAGLTSKPRS